MKISNDDLDTITMLANSIVNDQHSRIGQPRVQYIHSGDVMAVLRAVKKWNAMHPDKKIKAN
jgi:hypothetical protein